MEEDKDKWLVGGAEAPSQAQKDGKPRPADYPEAVRGFRVGLIDGDGRERRDAVVGIDGQIRTVSDWINKNREETEAERIKREKRERSGKIISAVSDGLRALGNLFYTTRYAPNMYNHEKGSQLGAKNAAMERAKKERDKLHEQHLNFALKLGDLKNQRAATLQALKDRQQARKLAKEKADRDAEEYEWEMGLRPFVERERKAKAEKAVQDAAKAKVQAEKEAELITSKINKNRNSGLRGGRSGKKYVLHAPDGTKTYDTAAEYNAAVYEYAERYPDEIGVIFEAKQGDKTVEKTFSTAAVAGQVQALPKGAKPKKHHDKGTGYGDNGKGAGYGN